MRKGGRLLILLGVTLALAAAVLAIFAFRDTDSTDVAADPEVVMVSVVEAARDIPTNHVITEDDISIVEVEENTVAPNTARSTGQVIGLATAGDIVSGQRVLMANLSTPGLSHIVSDGMRAVAVPIDRVNALGGMIRADDHIDIIYSIAFDIEDFYASLRDMLQDLEQTTAADDEQAVAPTLPPALADLDELPLPFQPGSLVTIATSDGREPVTKILLQNIRVVRVIAGDVTVDHDGRIVTTEQPSNDDENEESSPEATDPERLPSADLLILEVDPVSAELIKFILDYEGQFHVALRGPEDDVEVETPGMTYRQLVEDYRLPIPMPAEIPEEIEEE
jgi:pilus assembly protein CpaB